MNGNLLHVLMLIHFLLAEDNTSMQSGKMYNNRLHAILFSKMHVRGALGKYTGRTKKRNSKISIKLLGETIY